MRKRKKNNFLSLTLKTILIAAPLLISLGCPQYLVYKYFIDTGDTQDIQVDFYPGSAEVIVKEIPEAKVKTPGILKLPSGYKAVEKVNYKYELYFIKNGYKSPPVLIESVGSLKGPRLKPANIFVIHKEEAQKLGDIEPLTRALKSEIAWVRADAAEALGNIGNVQAVDFLINAMEDKEPSVRVRVAEAMGKLDDPRAHKSLVSMLRDKNENVWQGVMATLGEMSDVQTLGFLETLLKDEDSQIRERATLVIGMIEDSRSIELLIHALKDSDEYVQRAALSGIFSIGDRNTIKPLIGLITTTDNIDAIHEASECLWKIGGEESIAALIDLLKEGRASIRPRVILALGEIGPFAQEAIPLIVETISEREFRAVKSSKFRISTMKRPGGEAVENFLVRYNSRDTQQRIIEERIQSRARGGPGISSTQTSLVVSLIGDLLAESARRQEEEEREQKRLRKAAENMEINELNSRYKNYFKIGDTSSKLKKAIVTTKINLNINSGAYALYRMTGEDFGADKKNWKKWWEENKEKYLKE